MNNWFTELIKELGSFFLDITKAVLKPVIKIVTPKEPQPPLTIPFEPMETLLHEVELTPSELLYATAKARIGVDASPHDIASDEFGCMESVDQIYFDTFGHYISEHLCVSTYEGFKILNQSPHFQRVYTPEIGVIILSPTGTGNGKLKNGDAGILGVSMLTPAGSRIMSNDSSTGRWSENYTIATWKKRYQVVGGMPVLYYKPISK